MLDSLLTLTKGRALWMIAGFPLLLVVHWALVKVTGVVEPIFLLAALLLPVALLVMGAYTLGKKLLNR